LKRVRFTAQAADDVQGAFSWYEGKHEGLGVEFLDCVDQAVGQIARNPSTPRTVMPGVRRVPLRQFTAYALWYQVLGDAIVVGCLHGKRSPSLAKKRARGIQL
jgi:toxin ParE1/3/4